MKMIHQSTANDKFKNKWGFIIACIGSSVGMANIWLFPYRIGEFGGAAFLIPYIFALNPAMLFINSTPFQVVQIIITSFIGMAGVAAGLEGYLIKNMNVLERIMVAAGGLAMLIPGTVTDLIGVGLVVVVIVFQLLHKDKKAVA